MITPLHFNPRSREGSDGSNPDAFQQRILFQSTLPRRERLELSSPTLLDTKSISIHAPAKGATDYFFIQLAQSKISIHAPAKGATPRRSARSLPRNFNPRSREGSDRSYVAEVLKTSISIHAPAKGATERLVKRMEREAKFQSTLPRRERRVASGISRIWTIFQSTLPRRERRTTAHAAALMTTISIHAPAKGATLRGQQLCYTSIHFNPRSREGSDCIAPCNRSGNGNFNPRSREGSDVTAYAPSALFSNFNPRSREGSDKRLRRP